MRILMWIMLAASAAFPATVYDNFSPGNTHEGTLGLTVGDGAYFFNVYGVNGSGFELAIPFTAQAGGLLHTIDVGITRCGTGSQCDYYLRTPVPDTVIMGLYDNTATGGGTLIEQISKTGTIQPWPNSTSSIVTGTSILNPLLVNGAQYWLRISVQNPVNDALVWMRSTNQQGSLTYGRSNSFDWAMVSGGEMAFRITSDVPEPGALGMTGIALCAIGLLRRRG